MSNTLMTNKLNELLDKLTAHYLYKGIQPSDLADNVFDEEYISMSVKTNKIGVCVDLVYFNIDETTLEKVKIIRRYQYNNERFIQTIEEFSNSKLPAKTLWCREQFYKDTIANIVSELKKQKLKPHAISKILNTLPDDLKNIINHELKNVA